MSSKQKPFQPVPGPFGIGIDEQATIAAFEDYIGSRSRLESLWRIARNSHREPKYPFFGEYHTVTEVFKMKAKKEGFTENEINGYLTFGN